MNLRNKIWMGVLAGLLCMGGNRLSAQDTAPGSRYLDLAAEDLFDNGGKLQMWNANGAFNGHMPNQQWLFYKIKGNKYAILSVASGKALDARDGELSKNGGGVVQWSPISNDQSQVWILEKAN